MQETSPARHNAAEIETWLIEKIAALLGVPADSVDPEKPLIRYNIESVAAVGLSGELEKWVGCRLPPTLMLDSRNIREMAETVVEEVKFGGYHDG